MFRKGEGKCGTSFLLEPYGGRRAKSGRGRNWLLSIEDACQRVGSNEFGS